MAAGESLSRRLIVAAAAAASAAALWAASLPQSADAAKPGRSAPSLYVLSAGAGELDRVSGGGRREFRLVLSDPDRDVTAFTDRPARRAGQQKLRSFVRQWNRLGFRQDPPNAALVIADAPGSGDVLVVELSKPHLGADRESVAFRAEVVKGSATGALRKFRKRADRRVADRFGEVSLFIDPSGEAVGLSFTIQNAPPGSPVNIVLSNASFALEAVATIVQTSGPADAVVAANALLFAPTGTTAVNGSVQTGAVPNAGAAAIRGTVQSLPPGASASVLNLSTQLTTPLAAGPFSIPLR